MKLAIFGLGTIGSEVLFSILERERVQPLFSKILLVSRKLEKSIAVKKDSLPGFIECYKKIKAATYDNQKDIYESDIIVVCAGRRQNPGEMRIELAHDNRKKIKGIFEKIKLKKSSIVIVATNPVELMSHLVLKLSGLPYSQVIGSGGDLDLWRLKLLLSLETGKNPNGIKCYILGEHGENAIPIFREKVKNKKKIVRDVREYAQDIIKKRGFTSIGPSRLIADLARAIIHSIREGHKGYPRHVAYYDKKQDTYLTGPVYLAFKERGECIVPFQPYLNSKEREELRKLIDFKRNKLKELIN